MPVWDVLGNDADARPRTGSTDLPVHDHGASVGRVVGDEVHRLHHPLAGDDIDDAGLDDVGIRSRLARCARRVGKVSTIRYDPPGRASNRSNLPVIPPGGSHTTSASGSTKAVQTLSSGAAITRDALSVRGILRP